MGQNLSSKEENGVSLCLYIFFVNINNCEIRGKPIIPIDNTGKIHRYIGHKPYDYESFHSNENKVVFGGSESTASSTYEPALLNNCSGWPYSPMVIPVSTFAHGLELEGFEKYL